MYYKKFNPSCTLLVIQSGFCGAFTLRGSAAHEELLLQQEKIYFTASCGLSDNQQIHIQRSISIVSSGWRYRGVFKKKQKNPRTTLYIQTIWECKDFVNYAGRPWAIWSLFQQLKCGCVALTTPSLTSRWEAGTRRFSFLSNELTESWMCVRFYQRRFWAWNVDMNV